MANRKRSTDEIIVDIEEQLRTQYIVDENGCWIWQGQLTDGYGIIHRWHKRSGYKHYAHTSSYQYHKGPIPDGLMVCHSCDVNNCINPDHLWLGTNQDNQLDSVAKGRARDQRGEKNSMFGKPGWLAGRTGEDHPAYGRKHTDESRLKMSISVKNSTSGYNRRGKKQTEEHTRNASLGRKKSIERRKALAGNT